MMFYIIYFIMSFPQKTLDEFIIDLSSQLPAHRKNTKTEEKKAMIAKYTVAILGNFQLWLTQVPLTTRSPEARYA